MGDIFHELLIRPLLNILVLVYQVLFSMGVPYALGFSIIVLTIIIRLVMYPLIASQLKTSKKMQTIAPHVKKLRDQHKNDAARLQQETMRLYKEHGVNPAAGCLPILIQMPIIWALYSVLQQVVGADTGAVVTSVNSDLYTTTLRLIKPWDTTFFSIPLAQHASSLLSTMPVLALGVPIVTGVLQFIQTKMMMAKTEEGAKKLTTDKKKESSSEDFASAFQTQSLYIFPVMIAVFSYNFPMGLSLYWNTFTFFGILQQYKVQGLGGLEDWKNKFFPQK